MQIFSRWPESQARTVRWILLLGWLLLIISLFFPAISLPQGMTPTCADWMKSCAVHSQPGNRIFNTQLSASPEELLTKLKTELSAQGYKERQINTVVGAWGFNLVMEPPGGTSVDGTPADKVALLVAQAAAIAPGRLNLNLRFEASGR